MKAKRRQDGTADVITEVKVWMARRRMSQVDVAAAMGVDHTWVGKRLSGKVQVSVDDLLAFADALDVAAIEFFRVAESSSGATINYRKSA